MKPGRTVTYDEIQTEPLDHEEWSLSAGADSVFFDLDARSFPGEIVLHALIDQEADGVVDDLYPPQAYPKAEAFVAAQCLVRDGFQWLRSRNPEARVERRHGCRGTKEASRSIEKFLHMVRRAARSRG